MKFTTNFTLVITKNVKKINIIHKNRNYHQWYFKLTNMGLKNFNTIIVLKFLSPTILLGKNKFQKFKFFTRSIKIDN